MVYSAFPPSWKPQLWKGLSKTDMTQSEMSPGGKILPSMPGEWVSLCHTPTCRYTSKYYTENNNQTSATAVGRQIFEAVRNINQESHTCFDLGKKYLHYKNGKQEAANNNYENSSWVVGWWWCMPLVPALRRQRQADLWVWGQFDLQSVAGQPGLTEKPCLWKQQQQKQKSVYGYNFPEISA